MKKPTFLYIPLLLLFLLTATVFVLHAGRVFQGLGRLVFPAASVRIPFEFSKHKVGEPMPEAVEAGILPGDTPVAINGVRLLDDATWQQALSTAKVGEKVIFTMARTDENGQTSNLDLAVTGQPLQMSLGQTISDSLITVIFLLLLPALSFSLGFYVALVRPRDPLAWVLLMLLLSVGSIATEGGSSGTLIYFFQQTMMNFWGIWMLLFGIYFPERWDGDKKFPWAKWILLVPLMLCGVLNFFEQLGRLFGWRWLWEPIDNLTAPYDKYFTILAMVATGLFFALMAVKSGTLENKDSRRRLRILYVGTSLAMLPALSVVIIRIVGGGGDSFFELVPAWYAIFALVALLLFPLTMAYVIVVQRAMDVSVVIRQGLQYALAKNGVLVLQILLSFGVIVAAASFVSNTETNRPQKIIFIALGITGVFLIRMLAGRIKIWTDRRFFREAYNSEQILTELSEDVRTMVETRPLLETVSNKISESLHVPQVALLLRNGASFQPAHALGYDSPPVAALNENARTIEKLKKNEPVMVYQDDKNSWVNEEASEDEREDLRELNSQLLLPLGSKENLSGVISLSPKRSEEPYSPNDLRLLKLVAAQTGMALENSRLTEAIVSEASQKERLNRELEIAREVQERLFPQDLPEIAGLEYYGACRPALGVGGDYYDFIELPEGRFGIAIGDVSGKGIGASLMMASLQASLRGQALHYKNDLAELMKQVNTLVYEASTSNRYATFFYAQYLPETRMLSYVNAGHNPPFLLRPVSSPGFQPALSEAPPEGGTQNSSDFEILRLEEGGAVVGMLPTMLVNYAQGEIELKKGDLLVGYTDGISEAMNPAEEEWGEENMCEQLKACYGRSAEEILHFIVERADEFASGAKQHDDMTMIIIKVM
jgi:sigma-B regulation protein RsbU (phosphoserine phosphatase)